MTAPAIKYPEFIVSLSNEHASALFVEGFVRKNELSISPTFQSGITIRQRQWLDLVNNAERDYQLRPVSGIMKTACGFMKKIRRLAKKLGVPFTTEVGDNAYRQLLPYVTFRRGDQVLPYLRGKAVGEKRLAGNVSVGWGGHIDIIDLVFDANSVIDVVATVMKNIKRELGEEMRLFLINDPTGDVDVMEAGELVFNGFINDNSNEVGRLHLGLSFDFKIKDEYDATARETELRILPWKTKAELYAMPDVNPESWTDLYLKAAA
jgi:predicted NUDIX family phosphoesterase